MEPFESFSVEGSYAPPLFYFNLDCNSAFVRFEHISLEENIRIYFEYSSESHQPWDSNQIGILSSYPKKKILLQSVVNNFVF